MSKIIISKLDETLIRLIRLRLYESACDVQIKLFNRRRQ